MLHGGLLARPGGCLPPDPRRIFGQDEAFRRRRLRVSAPPAARSRRATASAISASGCSARAEGAPRCRPRHRQQVLGIARLHHIGVRRGISGPASGPARAPPSNTSGWPRPALPAPGGRGRLAVHLGQKGVIGDDLHHRRPHGAAQRVAAIGGPMRARHHARGAPSVASTAPSGKPPPMPLATIMMSGVTPAHSCANSRPVRPMPHCTSSRISSVPVHRTGRAALQAGVGQRADAALALHRVRPSRRRSVGDRGAQRVVVAPGQMHEARHQRAEALDHLFRPRRRDGPGGPAMERPRRSGSPPGRAGPLSYQYLRAILIASSAASVPELVKKTVSAKVRSTSIAASRFLFGMR
jgi:hypothetical protein